MPLPMSKSTSHERYVEHRRPIVPSTPSIFMVSVIWTLLISSIDAFLPSSSLRAFVQAPPLHNELIQPTTSSILMARQGKPKKRSGASANGKSKSKKGGAGGTKGNNKSKKKKSNGKSKKGPEVSKASAHLPPWQIMSDKDAKQNIKDEKIRREAIRTGQLQSSVTSLEDKLGDVNASSSLLKLKDRQLFNWKRFKPERDVASMTFEGAFLGNKLPPLLGVPEVAFLGRSNVGKSSLLNQLSKRASDASSLETARVGKTPGATASVNLYSLQGKKKERTLMAFADLPGFGYAKLSKGVKESVEMAAERYLGKRRELALGILLVDVRRVPSDDDRAVLAALYDMGVPLLVVATKVDKLKSNALSNQLEEVRVGLGLPEGQPFCVSSVSGVGIKQLWTIILDACEDKVDELREKMETGGKKIAEEDAEAYGNIQLDDEGNFIDDEIEDEGFEWIQSFAYHDDSKTVFGAQKEGTGPASVDRISEESKRKMKENEDMQIAQNEALKVRNLKKAARKLQREGKL